MKKFFLVLNIVFVFFLSSCKEKDALLLQVKEINLATVVPDTLTGTLVGTFPGLQNIYTCDSLLLVETTDPSSQLKVISCNTLTPLAGLCSKGRAKNEFNKARSYCKQIFEKDGDKYLIISDNSYEMKCINITQSLRKKSTVVSEVFQPIVNGQDGYSLYLPNKNRWFTHYKLSYEDPRDEIFFPPRFVISDEDKDNSTELPVFGRIMHLPPHTSYPFYIYRGCMRIKPDQSKVVFGHYYMPYMFVFDLNESNYFAIHSMGKISFEDDYPDDDITNIDCCISDICTTDEYIIALCPNGKQNGYIPNNLRPMIRIFTWEGECVSSFTLDKVVSIIAFDEINKVIFAQDNVNEEIYKYDINSFV